MKIPTTIIVTVIGFCCCAFIFDEVRVFTNPSAIVPAAPWLGSLEEGVQVHPRV
jgi:hypothetical protein